MGLVRQRLDVERLVTWALRDQGLGWGGGDAISWMDLGTLIDSSPSSGAPSPALMDDDDALIVKAGIDGLPMGAQALVVTYGRTGLRPDWADEGEGHLEQARDGQGRRRWIWDDPTNRTGDRRPMMQFVGLSREQVASERSAYARWWDGLSALVAPLNDRLRSHEASGPQAPREPWLAPERVVLMSDGRAFAPARADRSMRVSEVRNIEVLRSTAQAPIRAKASEWEGRDVADVLAEMRAESASLGKTSGGR